MVHSSGQVSVEVEEPKEAEKNFQSCLDILGLETTNKYNISLLLHVHNLLGNYQTFSIVCSRLTGLRLFPPIAIGPVNRGFSVDRLYIGLDIMTCRST